MWNGVDIIEKVKEKKGVRQNIKAKGANKPKELVKQGLQDGIERVGQNIRKAGQIERQEDKQDDQSAYGVNKTEAAAGASAQAAYVLGRKLA